MEIPIHGKEIPKFKPPRVYGGPSKSNDTNRIKIKCWNNILRHLKLMFDILLSCFLLNISENNYCLLKLFTLLSRLTRTTADYVAH